MLIIALDDMDWRKAEELIRILHPHVWGFKVNDLLLEYGCSIISCIKQFDTNVFCDPKLYDIPNTVANSVRKLIRYGADIITVHSKDVEMLQYAVKEGGDKIFAVTVLTSDKKENREKRVKKSLKNCLDAGIGGIVCSSSDLHLTKGFKTIVPGIRPTNVEGDDQKHTTNLKNKINADYFVVGRPVIQAKDPLAVVMEIKKCCSEI